MHLYLYNLYSNPSSTQRLASLDVHLYSNSNSHKRRQNSAQPSFIRLLSSDLHADTSVHTCMQIREDVADGNKYSHGKATAADAQGRAEGICGQKQVNRSHEDRSGTTLRCPDAHRAAGQASAMAPLLQRVTHQSHVLSPFARSPNNAEVRR